MSPTAEYGLLSDGVGTCDESPSFLLALFGCLIGLSAILVFLNVATNISLIADATIAKSGVINEAKVLAGWIPALLGTAGSIVLLIFGGTYFSRKKYLQIIRSQADNVLKEHEGLLNEISSRLATGEADDYRCIWEIREFLQNQSKDFPELTVIYSGIFADKLAFYKITDYYSGNEKDKTFSPKYFACDQNLDCDYLSKFFSGTKFDVLQRYSDENDFCIYIPIVGKESRFVLLLARRVHYGKIGS